MKLRLSVLFFAIAAVTSASEDTSSFIVGGTDATIEDYPYMAGVFNFGLPSCGGTIISSRTVLTAAHCFILNTPATVSVVVGGSRRRGQDGISYRAIRLLIHPEYVHEEEPFHIQNDVAVIRTLRRFELGPSVQVIPLGVEPVPNLAQVTLTGWGLLGDSFLNDRADQLQRLDMVAIPNALCSLIHEGTSGEGVINDEKVCVIAGNESGGCGGDSGGPITWNGNVVGIASWTVRPCGTYPTVFIRVSEHIQWIRSQY